MTHKWKRRTGLDEIERASHAWFIDPPMETCRGRST